MAYFRDFLIQNGKTPDETFDENDEETFVSLLLEARLLGYQNGPEMPFSPQPIEALEERYGNAKVQAELKFVAGFLCFFRSKPFTYMESMRSFRSDFVPGFSYSASKQTRVLEALRQEFFTAQLDDLERSGSLDRYLDPAMVGAEKVPAL